MKIAIISDTHDNYPNLEKALAWMKENQIEQIIHCGDLCAPSMIKNILGLKFFGLIHMIFGNIEDRDKTPAAAKKFPQITHYGDQGEIEIPASPAGGDGKKIAFVHYPLEAKELAKLGDYDIVFYGHTHKPWEETIGRTRLANPGTSAGMFAKATFAVYDTKNNELELKILEKL